MLDINVKKLYLMKLNLIGLEPLGMVYLIMEAQKNDS